MKKAAYFSVLMIIIVVIVFTALIFILRYDEKGESNMPFDITKISIISTTDGQDVEDKKNTWSKLVSQNNDIYIYIEKNESYEKTEAIKSVVINNFKVVEKPQIGEISFYQPSSNDKILFENNEDLKTEEIIFLGKQSTKIKSLEISNQGGIIAFRCANENIGTYKSNNKELDYNKLLQEMNVEYEKIKMKNSFDITIVLENEKKFKSTIELELPVQKIIEEGTSSEEITDMDIIFKRIEN